MKICSTRNPIAKGEFNTLMEHLCARIRISNSERGQAAIIDFRPDSCCTRLFDPLTEPRPPVRGDAKGAGRPYRRSGVSHRIENLCPGTKELTRLPLPDCAA
jgi:hypothetical protein